MIPAITAFRQHPPWPRSLQEAMRRSQASRVTQSATSLRADRTIQEVILSGGDPLNLGD